VFAAIATLALAACSSTTTIASAPSPAKCGLTLSGLATLTAEEGAASVTVTTQPECAWTASTEAAWISGFSPSSGQGQGTLSFQVAANPQAAARDADVMVNDERLRVTQAAATCRFTISPSSDDVGAEGTTGRINVTTPGGCNWSAKSSDGWITVTAPASGSGTGTVAFRVAANSGGVRSGTINIENQTFAVRQASASSTPAPPPPAPPPPPPPAPAPPPPCTYRIATTSASFDPSGGSGGPVSVTTAAGCAWTAVSNASWVDITAGANGSGSGSVSFSVQINRGNVRSGTLTIAGRTFTVQQGTNCVFILNRRSANIGPNGGVRSVNVTTTPECDWTASTGASWIRITAGGSSIGSGSVDFQIAPNTGPARSATVTVAGGEVDISQNAALPGGGA
jgi:hypothetical protein